jgi:hypothetical protein
VLSVENRITVIKNRFGNLDWARCQDAAVEHEDNISRPWGAL